MACSLGSCQGRVKQMQEKLLEKKETIVLHICGSGEGI